MKWYYWLCGIVLGFFLLIFLLGIFVSIGTDYGVSESSTGFWVFVLLIAIFSVFWIFKKKIKRKPVEEEMPVHVEKVDYVKVALESLKKAKKLFSEGRSKDAYEKASWGLRFYVSHKYGDGREITSYEAIKLKDNRRIRDCLNMCGMVEFAKYNANEKDFNIIINTCLNIIGGKDGTR